MKKLFVYFLLFGCAYGAFTQNAAARFIEVSGTVEIKEESGWKTAAPGLSVGRNTIISTGLKSSAVISLGSSRLEVRPLTMLSLEELVQRDGIEETVLYLRTGRVRTEVRPPTGIQIDFSVQSPTITASVRGTSFEFDGKHLWVDDGRVLLAGSSGQKVYVAEGQRSYVDENNQNRIVPPFEAETAQLRPIIPELASTGSGIDPPEIGTPPVDSGSKMYIGWP
ncbi:MAG: FecR family protein [Treponema sp.]|jgi:hypothetical protein|nr:FecR family protein [Treponema sp.]